MLVLGLVTIGAPVSAHYVDSEPNNSCAQADEWPDDNGIHEGFLDGFPNDYQDFHRRWVPFGEQIRINLHIDASSSNAITHVVLHTPSCVVAEFNYQGGHGDEEIVYTATTSGYWYAEVWSQIGWADYELLFYVPPPCIFTMADPATVNQVTVAGQTFHVEERGNPFPVLWFPVPLSGFILGSDTNGDGIPEPLEGQGTWVYEETNGRAGLQRGGIGIWGEEFLLLDGEDPIEDETCGYGSDRNTISFYSDDL